MQQSWSLIDQGLQTLIKTGHSFLLAADTLPLAAAVEGALPADLEKRYSYFAAIQSLLGKSRPDLDSLRTALFESLLELSLSHPTFG